MIINATPVYLGGVVNMNKAPKPIMTKITIVMIGYCRRTKATIAAYNSAVDAGSGATPWTDGAGAIAGDLSI
jgi:hypothetical protein